MLPRADDAVKIATALHTTVEYLVTGEDLALLSPQEYQIYRRASKWRRVIDDLEILSPTVANGFAVAIHAAAEENRSHDAMVDIAPRAENQ